MSQRGGTIARLLAGAWRPTPPATIPISSAAALDDCAPLLVDGGAAALAWRRVRPTSLASAASASRLRDAHRMQTLLAAVQRRQLAAALSALSLAGVRALCAKGWSVARHYSDPTLRAVGDIDLYVDPKEHSRAVTALAALPGAFDVHRGIPQLVDRDFSAVAARAEPVTVGGEVAYVLSPADHLRLLCLHALGHGTWRPLWLCDIGALIEAGGIDWEHCLAGSPKRARWVACAVAATRDLLKAEISSAPPSVRGAWLPSWLEPSILGAWSVRYRRREPIDSYWGRLAALPAALWHRWPNAIEATLDVDGDFDESLRLPVQLAGCVLRIGRFASSRRQGRAAHRHLDE